MYVQKLSKVLGLESEVSVSLPGTPKDLRAAINIILTTPMGMCPRPDVYSFQVIKDMLAQKFQVHMDSNKPEVYAAMKSLWKAITGEDLP
jgi:hypothetical protein